MRAVKERMGRRTTVVVEVRECGDEVPQPREYMAGFVTVAELCVSWLSTLFT